MQKPDRLTTDTVVLFELMCSLCAKLSFYDENAVNTALEWFEADAKGDHELELLVQPIKDLIAASR